MNYNQAREYINSDHVFAKPGLERVEGLLKLMENPERDLKCVHITGTNGKGSTSAYIAGALVDAGYKVGLFSSPYLKKINESIRVIEGHDTEACNLINDDSCISDEEFVELVEYIKPFADSMRDDKPTEFEILVAIMFEYFKRRKCDICVIEVGMGGKGDATNVIPAALVSVFTNIGIDHRNYLGDTIEAIATEKSGIIKKGTEVVCYPTEEKALRIIEKRAEELRIRPCIARKGIREYKGFESISMGMKGAFQEKNAAVVLETVELLKNKGYNVCSENVKSALKNVKLTGRFQIIREQPLVIADGGHNPQCFDAVTETLSQMKLEGKVVFLLGVMADKDYMSMLRLLKPFAVELVGVVPENSRALGLKELEAAVTEVKIPFEGCASVKEGAERASCIVKDNPDNALMILGSFYMIDEVLSSLCL